VQVDFTGNDDGIAALGMAMYSAGLPLIGFQEEEKNLETMFMRVTKGLVT
jgi:hypothetical protein